MPRWQEWEVQIDDGVWESAELSAADSGIRQFVYPWNLPTDDGVAHTVRYRATDFAGNVFTTTQSYSIVVDTVAPDVTVTISPSVCTV